MKASSYTEKLLLFLLRFQEILNSSLWQKWGYYFGHFLPHPFHFNVHSQYMIQRYVSYAIENASLEIFKEVEKRTEEEMPERGGDVVIQNKISVMVVVKWRETMTLKKEKAMDIVTTMMMIRVKEKGEQNEEGYGDDEQEETDEKSGVGGSGRRKW